MLASSLYFAVVAPQHGDSRSGLQRALACEEALRASHARLERRDDAADNATYLKNVIFSYILNLDFQTVVISPEHLLSQVTCLVLYSTYLARLPSQGDNDHITRKCTSDL